MSVTYQHIFDKAYNKMPQIFTSYDFGVQARSMGVPRSYTLWAISRFLLKRCGRESHMTWNKRRPALGTTIVSGVDSQYDDKYRSKLIESLASMPNRFSSKEFILRCVSVGIPRGVFDGSDLCATFLKLNTERLTYRSWAKTKDAINEKTTQQKMREAANKMTFRLPSDLVTAAPVTAPTIDECIEVLKSKGYRVMKPVSEWVEI